MKLTLILIIAITQGIILFIPQDKTLNRRANFPKKITNHGWKLIACILLTILCTVILFLISEKEAQGFDKKIRKRDSITEVSRKKDAKDYEQKLTQANAENRKVLLDYGLEMDEKNKRLQKAVEKGRDTTYRGVAPHLELYEIILVDSTQRNQYKVKYTFSASGATCYNVKIKMDIFLLSPQENISYWKRKLIPVTTSEEIETNKGYSTFLDLPRNDSFIKYYYFHIYGTYENQNKIKIKIDKFYGFNPKDSKAMFGSLLPFWKEKLEKFVQDH
jgi:hypothetical protein